MKLYTSSFLFTKERWWEKLWKIAEYIRGRDDRLRLRAPSQLALQGGVPDAELSGFPSGASHIYCWNAERFGES